MAARYVFVGAGAIGSALGGLLVRQGTDALLVARGEHARAVATDGLTVRCPDERFRVLPEVVTGPDDVGLGVDDVLVLTTKTQQAEVAVGQWSDVPVHDARGEVVGRAGECLPLLTASNGVASEAIALRQFERVLAVCVWFPTVMIAPGEIIVRTAPRRGVFHVGRYGADPGAGLGAADAPVLDAVVRDWEGAGFHVVLPPSVMAWKYRKLLANLGNALQALLGDASGAGDVARAVEAEGRAVLDRAGIAVVGDDEARGGWERDDVQMAAVPGEPEELGGSSWQSLVRGTGTIETDYLNGEIALVARMHGVDAPLNARLAALARRAARAGTPPGTMDADGLRSQLGL